MDIKLDTNGWFISEIEFYDFIRDLQKKTGIGYGRMMQIISDHWKKVDPDRALSIESEPKQEKIEKIEIPAYCEDDLAYKINEIIDALNNAIEKLREVER